MSKATQCGDEALAHLVSLSSGTKDGRPAAALGKDGGSGAAVWLVGYHTHESMLKKDPAEVWPIKNGYRNGRVKVCEQVLQPLKLRASLWVIYNFLNSLCRISA